MVLSMGEAEGLKMGERGGGSGRGGGGGGRGADGGGKRARKGAKTRAILAMQMQQSMLL